MTGRAKAENAFRTIGEVAEETGLPQHRLRYWEQRFPELRPLTRAGQRRYYRPEDVALVRRIDDLLSRQGYTIRGVQQLLASEAGSRRKAAPEKPTLDPKRGPLHILRDHLAAALDHDAR
ncbi:MerR family transcriptional regulator [Sphingomonas yantingensis]|jgi:DNA-binding transcriptional MerR regulator|uniref:DNA-binding transcriptional MerR regulator n=2 Tax=Sphingomonas TaxID=13687 RepID=A0A7W9EG65_9SPHN|nr:MerR family transcriptional regulator [Sphingomonas yantingensis]MBB5696777.1 DNA-binding transcriptional MerR regulator [Sphingomonas yantingensis]HCB76511.1 MerR family transcriptional regulator [Sphingomonas bacterium]